MTTNVLYLYVDCTKSSRGKISSLMGDVAKGIKSFKKGMASDAIEDSQPKDVSEDNKDSKDNN